ncbi:MAG: LytTR family DNA-binding domain-containing protein [Burkholderiaceae bacterium]|jgi:two-component system response regulator AlgR|nr:LytTR family DNA-binding domain-containing protein [Burkholderiaceae bacterium]
MDTLHVLIVDDELLARTRLRALLGECRAPQALVVGEADNAARAVALAQHVPVDVALLDIHMPGAGGMRLAQALRELPRAPQVVFVTAYAEYAVQAFELEAADYLTKPVRLDRLQAALRKAQRILENQRGADALSDVAEYLVISERGRVIRVPLADVLYLKAELKYVTVGTAQRQYLFDGSLNQLEEKYLGRFIRIHRNALVARHAVRELVRHNDAAEGEGWAVRLAGIGQPFTVSRRQMGALRAALAL